MAADYSATPLIALDAVVIDTETTGLDPVAARIVEIAAVRIAGGRLDENATFRRLVNPGRPIPPEASRIHGIDDSKVAESPGFTEVWPAFAEFIAGKIVIGHTVGFDLAILLRECENAGIAWRPPRTLDTRLLAQIAAPNLSGHSLEQLSSWLGLDLVGRHAALGDAIITAKIFLALLPRLREGNIRTLAEAERACLNLTAVIDEQHRAGWAEPVAAPGTRGRQALARIDTYPYRHRVADVMSANLKRVDSDTPLGEALKIMAQAKISSVIVAPGTDGIDPAEAAIVTERDVLRGLAAHGAEALTRPAGDFASKPLVTLPADAFVYRALGRMSRLRFRHLGVENSDGKLCGIVTARDLLRLRAQEAAILGDGLDQAKDVQDLAGHWARLPQVAAGLVDEGVGGHDIAQVISHELCALTRGAGIMAERRMQAEGQGAPPCAYALCVLGSGGRGESLLAMDQDNAVVFAEGEPGGAADRWFARFGGIVADILNEVGVPYCKGGVMARNEQWRGSLATWRERVSYWISRAKPADLLSVDIFFDLAAVQGDATLANDLWRSAFDMARGNAAFAKLLAEAAGQTAPALTMFGNVRTVEGRIDLKMSGLFGVVTAARVLAIRHHVLERATPARLAGIAGKHQRPDLDALAHAQGVFLDLIVRQQVADIADGLPPGNKVVVKSLSGTRRAQLKSALAAVRNLDLITRDLLF